MYELIEHKKLDAAAASITFSNIPQIYTDLVLVCSLRSSSSNNNVNGNLVFNEVASGYSERLSYGVGSGAGASETASGSLINWADNHPGANATANTFGSSRTYIVNYTAANPKAVFSSAVSENNATSAIQYLNASLWNNTAAITTVRVSPASGNFVQHSSATLYGINRTSAIGRPKAIGGNITYANGYWVHTFTGSGTFYAQEDLEVDALVVAGGGGGGFFRGGGGGAGGALSSAGSLVKGGVYPVIVGSGGNGATHAAFATNGQNSQFLDIAATGGGRGNSLTTTIQTFGLALTGGSGGGGSDYANSASRIGAAGISGQGNAGGSATSGGGTGAGGGGAGSAAANATSTTGSAGGIGLIWNNSYYAGGGGGGVSGGTPGAGGLGGGGAGSFSVNGGNGTFATGGGGGGQGNADLNYVGGNGGSGVVIIRYKAD